MKRQEADGKGKEAGIRLSVALVALLTFSQVAHSQWGGVVRLSNSDAVSSVDLVHSPLVVQGSFVHAIWDDSCEGRGCLEYRRSTDGGSTWDTVQTLTGCTPPSAFLASGSGSTVIVAYESTSGGCYYRRSTDNGSAWCGRDTIADGTLVLLSSTSDGSFLAFYWSSAGTGAKRSSDNGASWSAPTTIWPSEIDYNCVLQAAGPFLCLAFATSVDSLMVVRSTNDGATWLTPVLAMTITGLHNFCFSADGSSSLHLAWSDAHTGQMELYYTRSTDGGATWLGVQRMTISSGSYLEWLGAKDNWVYLSYMSDANDGARRRSFDGGASWESESSWPDWVGPGFGSLCVAALGDAHWVHLLHYNYDSDNRMFVTYYRSKNGGTSWCDSAVRLSDTDNLERCPCSIVLSGGNVHVLWQDYEYGNYEMLYRRGDGLASVGEEPKQISGSPPRIEASPSIIGRNMTTLLSMRSADAVEMTIFDASGREIMEWPRVPVLSGTSSVKWRGASRTGAKVAPGVYFCVVRGTNHADRCRLIVL